MREPIRLKDIPGEEYRSIVQRSSTQLEEVIPRVLPIINKVREEKNKAVLEFTEKFDRVKLTADSLVLSREQLREVCERAPSFLISTLKKMRQQVEDFHRYQVQEGYAVEKNTAGSYTLGQKFSPVAKAAVYVPGGKAPYPSTAIMGCVPAILAGVREVVVCSPPSSKGVREEIMAAAYIGGAHSFVNAGGAQAIAALTYGTENIPGVDFIAGAGNVYVTAAKVYLASTGRIGIDCPAGPSEVLIIADDSVNPSYVIWDMLSQAEHEEMARSVLVTDSEKLARKVYQGLQEEIKNTERKNMIQSSLEENGLVLIVDRLEEAAQFANDFAPEHLEIMTKNEDKIFSLIKNAGSVFLGPFSPVAAGDYFTGTNHILPTGGAARFSSGLSVASFMKRISYQRLSPEALASMKDSISYLANQEGFQAHWRSVEIREGE